MISPTKESSDEQVQFDYEKTVQHILFYGGSSGPTNGELREDGTFELREDDSFELRE